jgi:hypothetical protein
LYLAADEAGSWFVPDGEEEPADGEIFLFVGLDVFDSDVREEVAVAFAFGGDCVPEDCLRIESAD